MNGANDGGSGYEPDVSSYDYDAPLDESGRPRSKYFAFRSLIAKVTGHRLRPVPGTPSAMTIAPIHLNQAVSLWNMLPTPSQHDTPLPMEDLGQSYGYVLYRTKLQGPAKGLAADRSVA